MRVKKPHITNIIASGTIEGLANIVVRGCRLPELDLNDSFTPNYLILKAQHMSICIYNSGKYRIMGARCEDDLNIAIRSLKKVLGEI